MGILVTIIWATLLYDQSAADRQRQLTQLGQLQMQKVQRSVDKYIHISERMAAFVVKNQGKTDGFSTWALPYFSMNRSLRTAQLAPDGIVDVVYPARVRKDYLGNLMEGPYQFQAENARKKHTADVESLYQLQAGGTGMLFIYPVYIFNDLGGERFWGYSIITVAEDDFIEEMNVSSLETLGINYELTWNGLGHDKDQVVYLKGELGPQTVEVKRQIQDDTWTIRLCDAHNWQNKGMVLFALWGGFLSSGIMSFMYEKNRRLKRMGSIDPLTGVYNRKGGDEAVAHYIKKEKPEKFMVMALDIDNFKFLNDVYGHDAGDCALKKLTEDIQHSFDGPMVVTRNGGDEFVIMKPYEEEGLIYEKIRLFAVTPHRLNYHGKPIDFYTSMGCASYPANDVDYKKLCVKADFALYNAKINGKAGWRKYDESLLNLQERVQLGFKLSDITDNIPGAILVYRATPEAKILFASDSFVDMIDCSSWEDFMAYSQGEYRNIVLAKDWKYLVEERKRMQSSIDDEKHIVFLGYRLRTKSGDLKRVIAAGHYSLNSFHGGVFYVSLFDEKNLTVKQAEK